MNDESQDDSKRGGADGARAGESAEQSPVAAESPSTCEKSLVMTPLSGLVFALLAGLTIWGALEMILPVFQLPDHLRDLGNVTSEEMQLLRDTLKVNQDRNAVVALVIFASTLALVLAGTELFHRRAGLRVVWGGLLAGLIAGIIALGAGAIAIGLHDALDLEGNRLGKTIIVQGALLGLTGLGIGLAIGTPLFRLRPLITCVAGCLIGGMLAALIFPITASTCLPNINTDRLVPLPGVGRLLWVVLATGLIGVTATGLGKEKKKKRAATT